MLHTIEVVELMVGVPETFRQHPTHIVIGKDAHGSRLFSMKTSDLEDTLTHIAYTYKVGIRYSEGE